MPSYLNNSHEIYNYPRFCQIWKDKAAFLVDYKGCDIPTTISDETATLLYALLCGKHYNSPIGYSSVGQWKQSIMATIYCFGPVWEKRLELQNKLRNLTDDEILAGSIDMWNDAANPSTPVADSPNGLSGTLSDKQLNFIKGQTVTLRQRSKVDAYAMLYDVLKTDVTTAFLSKFDKYFLRCVAPQRVPIYIYPAEDD